MKYKCIFCGAEYESHEKDRIEGNSCTIFNNRVLFSKGQCSGVRKYEDGRTYMCGGVWYEVILK